MDDQYKDLIIYCTYYKESQINNFCLDYLPEYVKKFNASDTSVNGDNINYLNKYLNELCTIYYAWKNEHTHKYVGFCHHRRFYSFIDLNLCNDNSVIPLCMIQCNSTMIDLINNYELHDVGKYLYKYLLSLNLFEEDYLYNYMYVNINNFIPLKESYIFNIEFFNKFCTIAFGFLDYLVPNWKNEQTIIDTIVYKKNDYFNKDIDYDNVNGRRCLGYMCEYALGIILSLLTNNLEKLNKSNFASNVYNKLNNHKKILLINNENYNDNQIFNWYNKNVKASLDLYVFNNGIIKRISEVRSIDNKIFLDDNVSQDINDYIQLNINQYIKTKDSISFLNDNYIIEKF